MSGKIINKPDIEIDESLIAQFEALPEAAPPKGFTEEKDALLKKYWPIKNHAEVARLLGFSTNTCLKRFRDLTNDSK